MNHRLPDTGRLRAWLVSWAILSLALMPPRSAHGQTAAMANYPLQILLPRPAGSSPDPGAPVISSNHRIFWAYPGALYEIRGAVIGGVFPYVYSLENAPSGMTIDAASGEIRWPNPQTGARGVVFRVVDAAGVQATTTWTIAVDAAQFVFLSATAPPGGDGSRLRPYGRISAIPPSTHTGKIVYFLSGTYDVMDLPRTGNNGWERVEFNGSAKPLSWLEYPGESAVIDFGWNASGIVPLIRMSNGPIYLDGFETTHSHNMAFQFGESNFAVIRRMNMHHQGPGENGANSAFLMFLANYGFPAMGTVIQDNTFSAITYGTGNCALKMYSLRKSLVEGNAFHTTDQGTEAIVAIKSDIPQFTVRNNTFYDIRTPAIGGNMHRINDATYGEILFNNVRAASGGEAFFLNQDSQTLRVDIYRNSFRGRVRIRNTDSDDGPFHFHHNVIVSSDPTGRWISGSRIHFENVTDAARVLASNNFEGSPSDNLVDATGQLSLEHSAYVGTHGFQLLLNSPAAPMFPRLDLPSMLPGGPFRFLLAKAIPAAYEIQVSTNLVHWLPVATNQTGVDALRWEDPETQRHPWRFYRVVAP